MQIYWFVLLNSVQITIKYSNNLCIFIAQQGDNSQAIRWGIYFLKSGRAGGKMTVLLKNNTHHCSHKREESEREPLTNVQIHQMLPTLQCKKLP